MRTRMILAIAAAILSIMALALLIGFMQAQPVGACECCPVPDVKAEWEGEWVYEPDYNDGTVTVTGTERIVCWETTGTSRVTEIRVKAGRFIDCVYPEGFELFAGCYEATWHDLSNAGFCTETPTAVSLTEFRALPIQPIERADAFAYIVVGIAGGAAICSVLIAMLEYRRRSDDGPRQTNKEV